MSNSFAQVLPIASTNTTLFTVPGNTTAFGTIFCSNSNLAVDSVRVAIVPSGNVVSNSNWLSYDTVIPANYPIYLQEIGLNAGDNVVVYSQNGTTSFTFTGVPIL